MFADLPDLLLLKIYARGVSILQTWQSTGTSTAAKVGGDCKALNPYT